MILLDNDRSLTPADIARAEAQMGIALPKDLRDFYLQHNGGRPEKRLFRRGDAGFVIDYFLPLIEEEGRPVGSVVSSLRVWDAVGPSMVLSRSMPIAYDEGGNNLLYSLDPHSFGVIYCTMPDRALADQVDYLCGSLAEFLAELQEWN